MEGEELILDTLDEENNISSFSVSVVYENGQVRFPQLDLKFDQEGVKRTSGINPSQVYIQITAKDLEFKESLGQGVGGYVQKAIYKPGELDIITAVKTVNINNKGQRHQMLNDLKVQLVGGKSDFIVQCFGAYYEAEEATIKIILEYMDIGSLRNLINILAEVKQRPQYELAPFIDEQMLASVSLQILQGIEFLHLKKGKIHRDIKPENILINSSGQVKLTDFGLSKELDKTYEIAKTFVGTAFYMSPERLDGKGCKFGGDIWGIGMVILELATGIYPYPASAQNNMFDLIIQINTQPSPELSPESPYSDLLRDFINQCLKKELSERPSVSELLKHEWIQKYALQKEEFQQCIINLINIYQDPNCNQMMNPNNPYINKNNNNNNNNFNLSQINASLNSTTLHLSGIQSSNGQQGEGIEQE